MILIVDSGSTKADWVILNQQNQHSTVVSTLGLNPEVVTMQEFFTRVDACVTLRQVREGVEKIYFYGAGCSTNRTKTSVRDFLKNYFTAAQHIEVHEDTYAAVYASVGAHHPGIVCINGTGSNVSYFDGHTIHQNFDSLGYLAMDDCSGSSFGRLLLKNYFLKIMPEELRIEFAKTYNVDADFVKVNFYKKENPNAYLASFLPFLLTHKQHGFMQGLIKEQINYFVKHYIELYPAYQQVPVYFVGSVSYFLQKEFSEALEKANIKIGTFIQKPLDGLIAYHKKG